MKINSIKIAKLYSFGPEQELNDLSYFNLFIGKNGTGKTNIFKILKEIPIEYRIVRSLRTQFNTSSEKVEHFENDVFKPFILVSDDLRIGYHKGVSNNDSWDADFKGILKIDYEELEEDGLKKKNILFQDDDSLYRGDVGSDSFKSEKSELYFRFVKGDIHDFQKKVAFLQMPQNENEFYKDLALMGSQSKDSLHILNFGLYYIFGLYYTFLNNGTFTQGKNIVEGKYIAGGKTQESTTELPSGVENCAKILTKFFRAYSSTVILLDEPELHLEPRIVRRLFKFLIWFLIREKPNKNAEEEIVFNQVEMVLREYSEEKQMLQEKHPNYEQKQLFIASHSPILINEFLNMNNSASIYEFETKLLPIRTRKSQNSHEGVFTCIRKVDSQIHSILDNLGVKGSDILQTNGVIWVEGPSDIVYIQKWLEMYTTENSLPEFRQGSNFEFCMFGGAVLKYLYGEEVQGTKQENLVNIFKLNTRGFIIVDSDKPDLLSKDKSTFAAAKELMKDTLGKDRFWCDSNVQTIEKYAIKAKVETWKYDPKCSYNAEDGKTERSFKRVKLWNDKEITLSDFEPSLLPNIKKLYESIKEWNRQ